MRLSEKAEKNESIVFFLSLLWTILVRLFLPKHNARRNNGTDGFIDGTCCKHENTNIRLPLLVRSPCCERASHFTSYKNKFGIISHQTFHLCCHGMTGSFNAKCPQDQCAEHHVRFINTELSCHMDEDSQGKRFAYRGHTHFFCKHIEHYNLTFGLIPLGILDC